jgi:SAM-dependent methyltransferase
MDSSCPSCAGPGEADRRFGDRFARCTACGLRWAAARETGADYGQSYYERGGVFNRLAGLLFCIDRYPAARLVGPGRRALEVGCGAGDFLSLLQGRAVEVHGLDFSEEAIRLARGRAPSAKLRAGTLASAGYGEGFFDVAWSFHVLEHVEDPAAFLRELARVLKPGGDLLLRVPNADGLEAALAGRAWYHFDWPFHVMHWNEGSLRVALERAGFTRIRFGGAYLEYRQSFLYAAFAAVGVKKLSFAAKVLTLPLQLLAMPVSFILALLGAGGTLQVRAVKRQQN